MIKPDIIENDIQKECEDYLNKLHIKYIPRFNENLFKKNRGIRKNLKGVPDLIVFLPQGVTLFFELKKPEKYILKDHSLSDDQKEWMQYLNAMGHKYYCIDNSEIFKKIIMLQIGS